jgi:hypothetical protein
MKLTWDGWKLVSVEPLNQDEQEINKPIAWAYIDELDGICEEGDWQINVTKTKEYSNQIGLFAYPMRELTDEEINKLWAESHEDGIAMKQGFTTQQHYFAHLILQKANEK